MGTPSVAPIMTKETITIRPKKFITNRLLARRQMVLDINHPNLPTPDKATLKGMLADYLSSKKGFKASADAAVIFGMKTQFGGSKSSCFALMYDNLEAAKKHEPKHRLIQSGHLDAPSTKTGRKTRKEKKNKEKKFRGTRKEKRVRPGK